MSRQLRGALFERAVLGGPKMSPAVTQLHPGAETIFKDSYLVDFLGTLYRANRASPIFAELSGILRKTSGLAAVVAEALVSLSDEIDVAVIFGSVARAAESAGSDIDLLVIGSVDFGAIVEALFPAQQQLAREINPKVFSIREWKSKLKEKSSFAMDDLAKPKIFLIGDEHELAQLAGHKP